MSLFIIAGAGIAGPIAALRLAQDGHRCILFERASKPHTMGGAVNVAPNGMRLLSRLGLRPEIEKQGRRVESIEFRDETGSFVGQFPSTSRDGFVSVRIMRSALQELLLEEVKKKGMEVYFGKELESISEDNGNVTATFKDGTTKTGDYIIGADGIHSKVRKYVIDDQNARPVHTKKSVIYGILDMSELPSVDAKALHPSFGVFTRKGLFFAAFTNDARSQLYWLTMKESEEVQLRSLDEIQAKEYERYQHVFAPVPQIISAANKFFAWEIYELPELKHWYKGKVILIGDAAHAMPPTAGQGISQAIEDCFVLARVLSKGAPLLRYEELRKARIAELKGEFKMQNKDENKGPWGHWLRVWTFWFILSIVSLVKWTGLSNSFGYDVDTVEI
jgi:2-polyprenyl-6-methoxyphenol hydroxylase-like FAD-dependent oxidoreductase